MQNCMLKFDTVLTFELNVNELEQRHKYCQDRQVYDIKAYLI